MHTYKYTFSSTWKTCWQLPESIMGRQLPTSISACLQAKLALIAIHINSYTKDWLVPAPDLQDYLVKMLMQSQLIPDVLPSILQTAFAYTIHEFNGIFAWTSIINQSNSNAVPQEHDLTDCIPICANSQEVDDAY